MAESNTARREASRNKVPPVLRRWIAVYANGVQQIDRYREKNETLGRGWTVVADNVLLRELPDGFRFANVSDRNGVEGLRLQIREV